MTDASSHPRRRTVASSSSSRHLWQPDLVLLQRGVQDHPLALRILSRCTASTVRIVDPGPHPSDGELLVRELGLSGDAARPADLSSLARRSLLLVDSDEIVHQMAAGQTPRRRCYNFIKIVPYIGTCPFQCAYCWFRDPVLIPRVNVGFFDRFPAYLSTLRRQGRTPTVFTFTHHKSDCLALDHLTGFVSLLAEMLENEPGFYVQFLSKADNVEALLDKPPRRGSIVAFSVNAPWIVRELESGTPPIADRLDAGRRLSTAGLPVLLRIDPMMPFDGWEAGYEELAAAIFGRFVPAHVTLGTPRFQDLTQLTHVVNAAHDSHLRSFMASQQALMAKFKPGGPDADGRHRHSFSNMSISYDDATRLSLYKVMVALLRERAPALTLGLCEEPKEIWDALSLPWSGDRSRDCSCNLIPKSGYTRRPAPADQRQEW